MKLAEALKKIHTMKGRLAHIWLLAQENSFYMEGRSKPEFELQTLLDEAQSLTAELRDLKVKTQARNQQVMIGNETLASAIIRLADMRSEVALRERILKAKPKSQTDRFWDDSGVVVYSAVIPAAEQRKAIEELSGRIELLDIAIQKANWQETL